jgi:hypothetical protein
MEVRRLSRRVEHGEGCIEGERIRRGAVGAAGRRDHAAEAGDDLAAEASGQGAGRTGIRERLRHGPKLPVGARIPVTDPTSMSRIGTASDLDEPQISMR